MGYTLLQTIILIIVIYIFYNYIINRLFRKFKPKSQIYKVSIKRNDVIESILIKNIKGNIHFNNNVKSIITKKLQTQEFEVLSWKLIYEEVI